MTPVADQVGSRAGSRVNPARKVELGQFMTPGGVAGFMASLFTAPSRAVRLLDAGAGTGSLTAAFLSRWGHESQAVSAYEIDPALAGGLRERFRGATIIEGDFIREAVYALKLGGAGPDFTHAILNPPYRKINSNSEHRALLRAAGLETVNLYSAFVGLALELMERDGEIVAIIPRSFCNGLYYKPFREWVLKRASIDHIHLFHSRTSAFSDDEVLQENVIFKLVRGKKQGRVVVTTSSGTGFEDLQTHVYRFPEIVHAGDEGKFIHIPVAPSHGGIGGVPLARKPLDEIGIEVSTGPVVDFRLKDFLRDEPSEGTVPLLYPVHFSGGLLEWPKRSRKPNALVRNAETSKWLYPAGFYTVVRRFSSKEELRRIVAHVVDPSAFDSAPSIAFENHLNVFHFRKSGLGGNVAHGLSAFLNSKAIDDYFRRFSGHTQVNATDLRTLRYPETDDLEELGRWARQQPCLSRDSIDRQVAALHGRRKQDR